VLIKKLSTGGSRYDECALYVYAYLHAWYTYITNTFMHALVHLFAGKDKEDEEDEQDDVAAGVLEGDGGVAHAPYCAVLCCASHAIAFTSYARTQVESSKIPKSW
jgi:hypothetical protein